MGGQLGTYHRLLSLPPILNKTLPVYTLLTEIPVVFLLYDSSFLSGSFLICIFAVSVWNGGGFYIEVFGRKYVFCHVYPDLTSSNYLT